MKLISKQNDEWRRFSNRLRMACTYGFVSVDYKNKKAKINSSEFSDLFSDDDWLLVLRAATIVGDELEDLGYEVQR